MAWVAYQQGKYVNIHNADFIDGTATPPTITAGGVTVTIAPAFYPRIVAAVQADNPPPPPPPMPPPVSTEGVPQ